MNPEKLKLRHEAHIAELMGKSLSLMSYQSEATHRAHPLQTKLVIALSEAKEAARELANALSLMHDGMSDKTLPERVAEFDAAIDSLGKR